MSPKNYLLLFFLQLIRLASSFDSNGNNSHEEQAYMGPFICHASTSGGWDCSGHLDAISSNLIPSAEPTAISTQGITVGPSIMPSKLATTIPSTAQTLIPSINLFDEPSTSPSIVLTHIPTHEPSTVLTSLPTMSPSYEPTGSPSLKSSATPTIGYTSCDFASTNDLDCGNELDSDTPDNDRRFYRGEFMCSPNKQYRFGMTLDAYLAICHEDYKVWEIGPFIGEDPYAQFQLAGNFVVYNSPASSPDFDALWNAGTHNNAKSTLALNDNGEVTIEDRRGNMIWNVEPTKLLKTLSPTLTSFPSIAPSVTSQPSSSRSPIGSTTYYPGMLFYDDTSHLYLSIGLRARKIATSGQNVIYGNDLQSEAPFLDQPDAAACLPAQGGGWHYLINSETGGGLTARGGVGRITFNMYGEIEHYKMVLEGTRLNCGGGTTPWNTFISCEEYGGTSMFPAGQCWEVHPEEQWPSRATAMGGPEGGKFESVAFDDRNLLQLKGFVTHDSSTGEVRRFSPDIEILQEAIKSDNYMNVLHNAGSIEYLELFPETSTFNWTTNLSSAKSNAASHFPNTEGIDCHDGILYFVSKKLKQMFVLDLDSYTYNALSTRSGAFNGQPDQIVRLLPNNEEDGKSLLYFLEDGGSSPAGIFARDKNADRMYTIIEGGPAHSDETTGLAFCDEGKRMMVSFQDEGVLYEITREDNQPFYGNTVNIKYHGA